MAGVNKTDIIPKVLLVFINGLITSEFIDLSTGTIRTLHNQLIRLYSHSYLSTNTRIFSVSFVQTHNQLFLKPQTLKSKKTQAANFRKRPDYSLNWTCQTQYKL